MDVIAPLCLLTVANGIPVLAALVLKERFSTPVDGGVFLPDGYPLFGASKTVRGIILAIVATALVTPLFNFSSITGAFFGFWAMVGDLLSSFIKRRLGFPPSQTVPGLDHVPESFLPLWFLRDPLGINWTEGTIIVLAFALLDLFLWYLLHLLYPRTHAR